MEINQVVKNNSFKNNIKIKEAFNNLLDNKVWIKCDVKQTQKKIGDFFYTVIGKNFDFKIDCYNNSNIVLEENQVSGTNWIDELDDNSFIAYVKINTGVAFCWSVKQLKEFKKSYTYKNRKSFTAWSNTTFKNFRLSEMPVYFILKFDTSSLLGFLKEDKYGDEKYVNIQGVVE